MESKGLSNKKLTTPTTTDNSHSISIKLYEDSTFCLEQRNATFTPPDRVLLFIVHKLDTWSQDLNPDFTLKDCFLGSIKLAKNADPDKYVYSGYDIGFNSHSEFSSPDGNVGKNVIAFGVDMSSSVHTVKKIKIS